MNGPSPASENGKKKLPTQEELAMMSDEEFERFERSTLMASDDMAEEMMDALGHLRSDVILEGTVLPRFGLLSLKAQKTPMYVYNHPGLKERFPTGFNDGAHVFVNEDHMRKLLKEEDASGGAQQGVVPLLLHHLVHMLMNHHGRFHEYPAEIVEIATDISVHSKLRLSFPDMQWTPSMWENSPVKGMPKDEMKKRAQQAEETIIRELLTRYKQAAQDDGIELKDLLKLPPEPKAPGKPAEKTEPSDDPQSGKKQDAKDKKEQDKKNKKDKTDEKGKKGEQSEDEAQEGAPGEPSDEAGAPQPGDQEGAGQPSISEEALEKALSQMNAAKPGEVGPRQNMDLREMAEVLEAEDMWGTKERLEIPDSWDYSKLKEKHEQTRLSDIDDILRSQQTPGMARTMGGGHLSGSAYEAAQREREAKLGWKLGLQSMLGMSMNFKTSDEEPGDLYYVNPKDMGLNNEIYIEQDLPHKTEGVLMVLIDSSGSITKELLKEFLSEIFGIIRNENSDSDKASETVILFVDDVIRGKPIIVDESNIDDMMDKEWKIEGRGGNDIGGTIRAAAQLEEFKEKPIRGMVYFTDLGDLPPKKEDCPPGVPLAFICPATYYQEEFIKAVKDFARVYPIEDGVEVNMTEDWKENTQEDISKSAKIKPKKGMGF